MEAEPSTGWNANTEKLLCLVVLDDHTANHLSSETGEAFFRAFIVQDRATGLIRMNFRFRYRDGKDSWFSVTPKDQQGALAELRDGIATVLEQASQGIGHPLKPGDVAYFEPPDDEGDFFRTIDWLVERDLINTPRVETKARAPRST